MQLSDPNDLAAHDLLVTLAHALANPFDAMHRDILRYVKANHVSTFPLPQV